MSTITYNFNPNDTVWCIQPLIPALVRGIITDVLIDSFNNIEMEQETLIRYFVYLPSSGEHHTFAEADIYGSQSSGLIALATLIDDAHCV